MDSEFASLERIESDVTEAIAGGIGDLDLCANRSTVGHVDENDSGVDTGATNPVQLQRALSNNSAGYASSSGGLDAQFASCNSSLLSICSDSHDDKTIIINSKRSVDCTSENGSESSSVSGGKTQRLKQSPPKKKNSLPENNQLNAARYTDGSITMKSRVRAASANRVMNNHNYGAPNLAKTERARSRDKQTTPNSQLSSTKRLKPDSLFLTKDGTPTQKSSILKRTSSVCRRTPSCTPSTPSTEDGRWPSNQLRPAVKVHNRNTNESLVIKTKVGQIVLEKTDKFSTTPRRKKVKSQEDLSEWRSNRSSSTTRDRMSSSTIVRRLSTRESPNKGISVFPPRYQKPTSKTLIYHEASIQTVITGQDIKDAFDGKSPKEIQVDAVVKLHQESQVDIRDEEIEQLKEKLKALDADNRKLRQNLAERSQVLTYMENQLAREREEKAEMQKQLQDNTKRVLGILELMHTPTCTDTDTSGDSLLMLESKIQLSDNVLKEKQVEINTLQQFCKQLQIEMSKSMQMQQSLMEEKKCFEKESSELQDFLQDEKASIFEALKDAESEIEKYEEKLKQKDQEMERLRDECRHLVRISEQRRLEYYLIKRKTQHTRRIFQLLFHKNFRQEILGMQTKSKILLFQQSHVAGATLALSDLGSRLNDLVEQLITSFNISEGELEV